MLCVRRALRTACVGLVAALAGGAAGAQEEDRRNWFGDPFEQASAALPGCPAPEGPLLTRAQIRAEEHYRAERGTTCWLEGRCADSNAYRRDGETNARVAAALRADARAAGTSLWVTTQRRFVYLQGCLAGEAQRAPLLDAVRAVEGVELVIDQTMVGTAGKPPYATATPPAVTPPTAAPAAPR